MLSATGQAQLLWVLDNAVGQTNADWLSVSGKNQSWVSREAASVVLNEVQG